MKALTHFLVLFLALFATASLNASADWGLSPPPIPAPVPPGFGQGGGPGWGGPGWDPTPPQREQYVKCSSHSYRPNRCAVFGEINQARVFIQQSHASCQLGETWGWQGNTIWVARGCSGTFLVYTY
jgi:hypothetical protein